MYVFTHTHIWLYYLPYMCMYSYIVNSEVAQSCPTLCDPMDCSLPGSSVHGIFQAIVLEWIAISFSRGSSQPRDQTRVSCIVDRSFTVWATREIQGRPVDGSVDGNKIDFTCRKDASLYLSWSQWAGAWNQRGESPKNADKNSTA